MIEIKKAFPPKGIRISDERAEEVTSLWKMEGIGIPICLGIGLRFGRGETEEIYKWISDFTKVNGREELDLIEAMAVNFLSMVENEVQVLEDNMTLDNTWWVNFEGLCLLRDQIRSIEVLLDFDTNSGQAIESARVDIDRHMKEFVDSIPVEIEIFNPLLIETALEESPFWAQWDWVGDRKDEAIISLVEKE